MIKKIIHTFSFDTMGFIFGFLYSILLARGLGPEGLGVRTLVLLVPNTLYRFLSINFFASIIYFLRKRIYDFQEITVSSLVFYVVLTTVEILSVFILDIFMNFEYLIFIVIFIILINLQKLSTNLLLAIGEIEYKNLVTFSRNIFNLVLFSILYFCFLDYFNIKIVLMLTTLTYIFSIFLAYYFIKKENYNFKLRGLKLSEIKKIIKDCISISKHAYLSNLANFLNYRVDQWLIVYFLNQSLLGIYSIAVNISERFWLISKSIATVLYPEVANRKKFDKIISKIDRLLIVSLSLGIIAWIISYFILEPIVLFIYGQEYIQVAGIFLILFPGIILFSIVKIVAGFFSGLGRPDLRVKVAILSTVLNLVANLYLIPRYSIKGAALSTVISYSVYSFGLLYIYLKVRKRPNYFLRDN